MTVCDTEWGVIERATRERLRLGVLVSSSPLQSLNGKLDRLKHGGSRPSQTVAIHRITNPGGHIYTIGVVARFEVAKQGTRRAYLTLEGSHASIDCVMWADALDRTEANGRLPAVGDIVGVEGKVKQTGRAAACPDEDTDEAAPDAEPALELLINQVWFADIDDSPSVTNGPSIVLAGSDGRRFAGSRTNPRRRNEAVPAERGPVTRPGSGLRNPAPEVPNPHSRSAGWRKELLSRQPAVSPEAPSGQERNQTMSLQNVTFVGNLGGDPVLRFSENGKPRATFSVAITEGQGDNEKTHWVDVTAFNSLAENVAESLAKGMRVVVVGRIDTYKREIETTEGAKQVTTVKFIAQEVSPSLVFARAKVTKVVREQADSGNGPAAGPEMVPPPHRSLAAAPLLVVPAPKPMPTKSAAAETAPAGVDAF